MKQRIITGLILATLIVGVFFLREVNLYLFDTFIALSILFSTAEVARVFIRSGRENHMELAVIYTIVSYLFVIWGINASFTFGAYLFSQIGILVVFFAMSFLISYLQKKKLTEKEGISTKNLKFYNFAIKKSLRTLFVMIYPSSLLLFLYFSSHIQQLRLSTLGVTAYAGVDLGLLVLLMIFLVTIATDTFAYFVGSTVGGKKLAPFISPKKTISGAIGGLIGAVLMAGALFLIFNAIPTYHLAFFQAEIRLWHFLIYGLIAGVFSQAGDLFASYIKRKARAKDYSSIFPGHGGFMDRLDGISFNAIFTFIFVMLFFL